MSSIAMLVSEFAATQQAGFEDVVAPVLASNGEASDAFENAGLAAKRAEADALLESSALGLQENVRKAGEINSLVKVSCFELTKRTDRAMLTQAMKTAATQAASTSANFASSLQGSVTRMQELSQATTTSDSQWQEVSRGRKSLGAMLLEKELTLLPAVMAHLEDARVAQLEKVRLAADEITSSCGKVKNELSGLENGMREQQQQLSSQMDELAPAVVADIDVVRQVITQTQAETNKLLGGLVDAPSSGQTPVKKPWTSPLVTSQVGKREDLIARFNLKMAQKKAAAGVSATTLEAQEEQRAEEPAPEEAPSAERVVLKEKAANALAVPQATAIADKPTLKRSLSKATVDDEPATAVASDEVVKKRVARTRVTRA